MTDTPTKKQGCPARHPQQSAPTKVQIAKGDGIPLCKKDKRILRRVRQDVSAVFDALDEIDNNLSRFGYAFYLLHLRSLLESVCRLGKLPRALTGAIHRAKTLEAAR